MADQEGQPDEQSYSLDKRFQRIDERLYTLEGSSQLHNRRHESDSTMLSRVLDNIEIHLTNHHGRMSQIRQGGGVTAAVLILGVIAEIVRRVFL